MTTMESVWLATATVFIAGLAPCGWIAWRRRALSGLVAVELAGVLTTLALVCLSIGFQRSSYASLPLLTAVLTWVSGLIYIRFLDRRP
jgi:multicomponent Na+:H+ antiporter subunit F